MEQPKIGEKVSVWAEGTVKGLMANHSGSITVEILNEETRAHCFVPLSAIEPKEMTK